MSNAAGVLSIVLCTALEESKCHLDAILLDTAAQLLLCSVWRVFQARCPSPSKGLVQWVAKVYERVEICAPNSQLLQQLF